MVEKAKVLQALFDKNTGNTLFITGRPLDILCILKREAGYIDPNLLLEENLFTL